MATPQEGLVELLRSMFDPDELRRVLVSFEPELRDKVSWHAPLAQAAFAAVEALERLGAIDVTLFERLAAERPRRADEIEAVRRSFPSAVLQVGARWGRGRYRLLERLGVGGFVEAWKAVDESTGEYVALRILHPHLAAEERRRQRFRRGAETQRRLHHRNIARVIDAAGHEGDSPYCVVEYVEGKNLGALVGEAPVRFLLEVVAQIGEALVHVHELGLVHRDVKPGNILVTGNGVGKLIDFDLVFVPSAMPLTATTGMGTRCFAAPEVLVGREDATAAADVYGLAATTLYVLTCGQLPGPTPQAPEVLLRSLPEDGALRRLLTAALQLDPRRRTGNALAYCRELRGVASSLANSTRVILVSEPAPLRRPAAPEFAADGSLRIWETAPGPLPPALEAEGIRAWPVADVEAAAANRRRGTRGVAEVVPHLEELRIAGRLLALRGHRAAWLGLTATDAAVLVLPDGHVVLHEQGVPGEDELALARRCVRVEGAPVAIVRGWAGAEPPASDIIGLSLAIREGAGDSGRLRRLARYARSPDAAAALKMYIREGEGDSRPASEVLKTWASGPPGVAGLRGAPGSGRSHQLQLLAAELAQAALSGGRPVALVDVAGWQPPFRLATVLRAPGECEGLRLAVETGECTLLIDGVEVPGEPVEARSMVTQLTAELAGWCGASSRVLLAVGAHGAPLVRRVFELCARDGAVTGVLYEAIEEDALRVQIRQAIVERGLLSLMHVPTLARALIDAAAEHRDITTAYLSAPLGEYLRGWCTLAALHAPGTTAVQFHGLLEALAALVWSQGEGVQREAILPGGVEAALRTAGRAGDEELARGIVDGALLAHAPQGRCVVVDWLAAEGQRRVPVPIRPYVARGRRQAAKPAADAMYFVHNAILEHLLAGRVVRELAAGRAEVLAGPRLSPGVCRLVRTMDDWSRAQAIVGDTLASGYRRDISENALLLAIVGEALASTRERPWQLADAWLAGMDLRGARLPWARMNRADLSDADLRGAALDDASLVKAMLRGADLGGASFVRVNATGADLSGARLDAACWRDARLDGSSVFASEARTAPPDLTGVHLAGVDCEATCWRMPVGSAAPDELLGPHAFLGARDAVWTPCGRKFVSLHASGHLVTWSARSLRPLRRWSTGPLQADRLALAADGRWLAGWKVAAELHLWDLGAETECTPACLEGLRVVSAAWMRQGSCLALVTDAGVLHVWEASSGALRTIAALGVGDVHVAFLPGDTRLLVWHAHAGRVEVWDVEAGVITTAIEVAKSEGGTALVVSPDGRRVALKMRQHLCLVHVDGAPALEALPPDPEFFSSVGTADWSSDGRCIVLEFESHGPVVYDLEKGTWSHHLDQHSNRTSRLRFSPDGTLVLGAGNQAGDLLVWDARTGTRIAGSSPSHGWIRQVALGPDRRALLAVRGGALRVRGLPDLGLFVAHEVGLLLPDGRGALAVREKLLVIEDIDGRRRHVLDRTEEPGDQVWEDMHACSDGSAVVCTLTDESRHEVAAWSVDTGGKIWGHPIARTSKGPITRCHTVDPRRRIGVSAGYHGGSGWIELRTADRRRAIAVRGQFAIVQLALDVARGVLACADDNGVITVWDLERWIGAPDELDDVALRIGCLDLLEPISGTMVFAPSGGVLAVPVRDQVRLFAAAVVAPLRTLAGHRGWVCSLNFGGGGRWLVAGDRTSEVRVWDWDTGHCVVTVCMASAAGDVILGGGRYAALDSPKALAGWMACTGHACVPLEMFDGVLEGRAEITAGLAEAFGERAELG